MINEYVSAAMAASIVKKMEDGRYWASIPGFEGLWADGDTRKQCLNGLNNALEEWLVIALRVDDDLPDINGISLNFGGKRWQTPLPAEN